MKSLHKFLESMVKKIKNINVKFKLNINEIVRMKRVYDIYVSSFVVDIIEKMDPRMKYICDTEEKLINMFNLLNYSFENEFKLDKDYKLKFNLIFNSFETDKEKCIEKKLNLKKKKRN